jgi:hypothetical protein
LFVWFIGYPHTKSASTTTTPSVGGIFLSQQTNQQLLPSTTNQANKLYFPKVK